MLQLSASMLQRHVLSLRTGTRIADIMAPIINPDTLKIEGFFCREYDNHEQLVLLFQDIREVMAQGLVVNDIADLTDPEELVRHRELLEQQFNPIRLPVVTISGDKVGKVQDYAFETTTLTIQKLYVTQSILKNLTSGSLSVDRTQIHEVTNHKIIINDLLETVPATATAVL